MKYFWPRMFSKTKSYVENCISSTEKRKPQTKALLQKFPSVTILMVCLGQDILGPLPKTAVGNQFIVIFSDYLSKNVVAYPIRDIWAESVACIFVTEVVLQYGLCNTLLTDHGTNFTSNLFRETCKALGIKKIYTSSYHLQTD